MKTTIPFLFAIALLAQGCEVVGGIFKAGYYTGLIMVILVILLVVFLTGFFKRK